VMLGLSVFDTVHCGAQGRYNEATSGVESCTVVFLGRHFLFTSSDTFAVGYIVQPQHTAKTRTAEISASGIAMGSVVR